MFFELEQLSKQLSIKRALPASDMGVLPVNSNHLVLSLPHAALCLWKNVKV